MNQGLKDARITVNTILTVSLTLVIISFDTTSALGYIGAGILVIGILLHFSLRSLEKKAKEDGTTF